MKRYIRILLLFILASLCLFSTAFAEGKSDPAVRITAEGFSKNNVFTDERWSTYASANDGNTVKVSCPGGVSSLYIEFDKIPEASWELTETSGGRTVTCGENGFLHEYQDLIALFGQAPEEVTLRFAQGTVIANIYGFSGEAPQWVQKWQPVLEKADLMLITTHSDDEQLFFAGVLPYYCMERKLDVQVVYFIQHFHKAHKVFDHTRPHEQLNGLWTVGVKNYPYISEFPDVFADGESTQEALKKMIAYFNYYGYKYDDFQKFVVDTFRRFKPLVVITHDFDGEYGHGAHILNADVTSKAVSLSGDASKYPESAEKYGTWVPQKLYVHLYKNNEITMDWDTPYESMGGKTPFQMTQAGFECHSSQHRYWFYRWLNGTKAASVTKASSIKDYSPCKYGLFYTSVGPDINKNDMMENVVPYSTIRAAEEAARIEAAAKQAEAEAAKDAEKRFSEQEELIREQAREQRQNNEKNNKKTLITLIPVVAALLCGILILVLTGRKRRS